MVVYYSYARPADEGIQSGCFWSSEDVLLGVRWRAEVSTKPTRKRFGKYNPQIKPYTPVQADRLYAKSKRRPVIADDVPLLQHSSDVLFRMLGYAAGWAHTKLTPRKWREVFSGLAPGTAFDAVDGGEDVGFVVDTYFRVVRNANYEREIQTYLPGGQVYSVRKVLERMPGSYVDELKVQKERVVVRVDPAVVGGLNPRGPFNHYGWRWPKGPRFYARWVQALRGAMDGLGTVLAKEPEPERIQVEKPVGVNRLKLTSRKVGLKFFQNFKSIEQQRAFSDLVRDRAYFSPMLAQFSVASFYGAYSSDVVRDGVY